MRRDVQQISQPQPKPWREKVKMRDVGVARWLEKAELTKITKSDQGCRASVIISLSRLIRICL